MSTLNMILIVLAAGSWICFAAVTGSDADLDPNNVADCDLSDDLNRLICDLMQVVFWSINDELLNLEEIQSSSVLELIKEKHLELAVADSLLESDRQARHDPVRPEYVVAILWACTPESFADRPDFFVRLLQYSSLFLSNEIISWFSVMACSLTPSSLSRTDQYGRTVLESYLLLCDQGRIELDRFIVKHFLRKTPESVLDQVRLRALNLISPSLWASIFNDYNIKLCSQCERLEEISQAIFAGPPSDHWRYLAAVLIMNIHKWDLHRLLDDDQAEMFLSSCVNLIPRYLNNLDRLMLYFYQRGHLQKFPLIFTNVSALCSMIRQTLKRLLDGSTLAFPMLQTMFEICIQDGDSYSYYLITDQLDYDYRRRLDCIRAMYLRMNGHQGPVTDFDPCATNVIRQAIQACVQAHDNPSLRPCAKFLLALCLYTVLNSRTLWPLINDLCSVPDDLLDYARSVNSLKNTFNGDIIAICQEHAAARHLFRAQIPERLPQMAPAGNLQTPESDVGRYQMQCRTVTNLLEEYEILEQIGRGASGFVFRARPVRGSVRPDLAIKMQPSDSFDAQTEAQFMSRYCHSDQIPGLVRLLDIFECGQCTFLVMELVQGYTVRNWAIPDDETEATQQLISITFQMLAVLHRLHQHGLRHGDIQHLNNFLVDTTSNSVVLLDFSHVKPSSCCSEDLISFYLRLCEVLLKVKEHVGLGWFESRPGPLYELESALKSWPLRSWSCCDLMADPIFDSVRFIGPRSTADLYNEFPYMGQVLIDRNLPRTRRSTPARIDLVQPDTTDSTPDSAEIPSTPTSLPSPNPAEIPPTPTSLPSPESVASVTSLLSSEQTAEQPSGNSELISDQESDEPIISGASEEGDLAAPLSQKSSLPSVDASDQYDSQHQRGYGKSKGNSMILIGILIFVFIILCAVLVVLRMYRRPYCCRLVGKRVVHLQTV